MNGILTSHETTSVQAFLSYLFSEPNSIAVRFSDGTQLETQLIGATTLVISSPHLLRRMFRPPLERSLSAAYIRGDFDIEGDFTTFFELFHILAGNIMSKLPILARLWLSLPDGNHSPQIVTHNSTFPYYRNLYRKWVQKTTHHHDAGNDFYALWLDAKMVYSCAYRLTDDGDMDAAQEHSLDLICKKLNLEPGERLLDINCGWGGFVLHAAKHYFVNALGMTLNQQQQFFANQRIAAANLGSTMVKLAGYHDLTTGIGTFDKIVSIGLPQPAGGVELPQHFAHIYELLKPGGLFLNHTISARPSPRGHESSSTWKRLTKNIFLGSGVAFIQSKTLSRSERIPVSEVNLVAEKIGFEVYNVENLHEQYVRTLRNWLKRLDNHRDQAIQLTDEAVYRTWKLSMSATIHDFEAGNINAHETLFYKPLDSHPIAPPRPRHCHGIY